MKGQPYSTEIQSGRQEEGTTRDTHAPALAAAVAAAAADAEEAYDSFASASLRCCETDSSVGEGVSLCEQAVSATGLAGDDADDEPDAKEEDAEADL